MKNIHINFYTTVNSLFDFLCNFMLCNKIVCLLLLTDNKLQLIISRLDEFEQMMMMMLMVQQHNYIETYLYVNEFWMSNRLRFMLDMSLNGNTEASYFIAKIKESMYLWTWSITSSWCLNSYFSYFNSNYTNSCIWYLF